jgi:hypothetical protein
VALGLKDTNWLRTTPYLIEVRKAPDFEAILKESAISP